MTIYHNHHIIPKRIGGTNDPSNLIRLSIQEHAEAVKKSLTEKKQSPEHVFKRTYKGIKTQTIFRREKTKTFKNNDK